MPSLRVVFCLVASGMLAACSSESEKPKQVTRAGATPEVYEKAGDYVEPLDEGGDELTTFSMRPKINSISASEWLPLNAASSWYINGRGLSGSKVFLRLEGTEQEVKPTYTASEEIAFQDETIPGLKPGRYDIVVKTDRGTATTSQTLGFK